MRNLPLAHYTSFKTGGMALAAHFVSNEIGFQEILNDHTSGGPYHILGFGSNTLISDEGLDGNTIIFRSGNIRLQDDLVIADAGVWWDDLVQYAIKHNLWGLEFTSAIPGSVGAAVVGNIAAYGQAVSDTLEWIEICEANNFNHAGVMSVHELGLEYRRSKTLQNDRSIVVTQAAFRLSKQPTKDLEYEAALSIAREEQIDLSTLAGRRETILKARAKAGSLWDYRDKNADRTAGSFFRNPLVDTETAERIMASDETGKSLELLKKMNQVHGGTTSRVSAAHVLLAAGFTRGQSWFDGRVRLHPQHVLKIENAGGATSQQIHAVANEIMVKVKNDLGVELEPEIRFLGTFKS